VTGTAHPPLPPPPSGSPRERRSGHGWMMIACCIPMLVIAIVLLATGVVGVGFIAVAIACTAMMALMMRGMDHGAAEQNTTNHHASHDQGMIHGDGGPSISPPHTGHIPPNDPRAR
jgi:hypothetical protein